MGNWETWHGFGGDTFSCLRELSINSCPNLVKVSPLSLPSLCVLQLDGCEEVVIRSLRDLTSVTSLTLTDISGLACLGDESDQQLMELESIEALNISHCRELRCLWKKTVQKGLIHLKRFQIWYCPVLEYFGAEEKEEGHLVPCNSPLVQLSALAYLRIEFCDMFVSFAGLRCPSLRHLEVRGCYAWEGLPEGILSQRESESGTNICPLEHLEIEYCPSFIRFPGGAMPKTLKRLYIECCDELKGLPDGIMNDRGLENLRLRGCHSLHFRSGELPISLKTLRIEGCLETEPMSEWKMLPNNICLEELWIKKNRYLKTFPECTLMNLTELQIWKCEGVECFWEGGFLAPNLKILSLKDCNNLRCITDRMQSLTSLQDLAIQNCRGLERFPEAGFPTSLFSLNIEYCENVKLRISEWGLHKLTSLRNFRIGGVCPDMVSFGEEFMPPSSLSSLEIVDFPNLASLSPCLSQCLTSLESLCFDDCPKLGSFPKELLLLPQLSVLRIYACPNLIRLCQKEKGEYWSYISLLPEVHISDDESYDWTFCSIPSAMEKDFP